MSHSVLEKYVGWTVGCTYYHYKAEDQDGKSKDYYFCTPVTEEDFGADGLYTKRDYKDCKCKFSSPSLVKSWEDKDDFSWVREKLGDLLADHLNLEYDIYCSDDPQDYEVDVYYAGILDSLTPNVVTEWVLADGEDSSLKEWLCTLPRSVNVNQTLHFEDLDGNTYEAPLELEMFVILDPESMRFKVESVD